MRSHRGPQCSAPNHVPPLKSSVGPMVYVMVPILGPPGGPRTGPQKGGSTRRCGEGQYYSVYIPLSVCEYNFVKSS